MHLDDGWVVARRQLHHALEYDALVAPRGFAEASHADFFLLMEAGDRGETVAHRCHDSVTGQKARRGGTEAQRAVGERQRQYEVGAIARAGQVSETANDWEIGTADQVAELLVDAHGVGDRRRVAGTGWDCRGWGRGRAAARRSDQSEKKATSQVAFSV